MSWDNAREIVNLSVTVFGLFFAIQGTFAYFFVRAIDRMIERQKSEAQKILANDFLINRVHDLTLGALERLFEQVNVLSWGLQRIIRDRESASDEKYKAVVIRALMDSSRRLEQALVEFMLISSDEGRRESAMREIAERTGNATMLVKLIELHRVVYHDDEALADCIKRLEARLTDDV